MYDHLIAMNRSHCILQRIAQTPSQIETQDMGLISGKMGAVIFFFHYARYSGEPYYEDIAMEFLEDIQHQLLSSPEKSYRHGVAGIGVAIDYLLANNFITADEDLLDDFDPVMQMAAFDPITDYSLYDGLTGYGWYWLTRTNSVSTEPILSEIVGSIRKGLYQLSATEGFDVFNFLFELNCTSFYGQNIANLLTYFRNLNLHSLSGVPYPRLSGSPAGEAARTYLLGRYWQFDGYYPSIQEIDEIAFDSKTLAWDGLYLLSVLSPHEKAWMGLL